MHVLCYLKVVANITSFPRLFGGVRGEPGNEAIANRPCLLTVYLHWLLYKAPEMQVRVKFSVVTEVSTFFILTQVGSGLKKIV